MNKILHPAGNNKKNRIAINQNNFIQAIKINTHANKFTEHAGAGTGKME